ncbi:MAG TPA: glycosyltransferase family 39 protein, partial [Candidatus Saccharimonadales bacterium]|nr:glycosyltransferase family 39 protein [Candidatus Saccharimonadales bacterium]
MIQKKPKYFKLFLLILLISSILRFWRIDALTTFSGDQGYDFLAVANMMKTHKITFLGPKIGPYNNIGNLYLGPAYYYLLSPALFLSGFDPLGPAVETAIMAVLTVYLIYLIGKNFLNDESGLVASALYGFNPYLISQSRAPSNPHMIPFFCALFIYSILKTVNSKFYLWPVLCGICLGVMFQLHYLAAVLIVVSVLYLLKKKQMTSLIVVLAAFVLTISP